MISRRLFSATAAGFALASGSAWAQSPLGGGEAVHPGAEAAIADVAAQRWSALADRVRALPPQSALVLLDDLANRTQMNARVSGLADTPGGAVIAGAIETGIAWRHRGAGGAETVTDRGARAFYERLNIAKDYLHRATEADRDAGLATAYLFRVYKGLEDKDALTRVLPKYAAATRKPVGGLSLYADAISAKWLGSDAEALEFERAQAASSPPSSHGLTPDVHINIAVGRTMSDDPAVAQSADSYLQDPRVRAIIVAAHEAFTAGVPDSDVYASYYAHSCFSFAFFQMQDGVRLRAHLVGLGGYVGGPWALLGDAARPALAELRRLLGLSDL